MEVGYRHNVGTAIRLSGLFCADDEIERLCPMETMRRVMEFRLYHGPAFARWIGLIWKHADPALKKQLIETLSIEHLREKSGNLRRYESGEIPLARYAEEFPEQMHAWLETEPRAVSQFLLLETLNADAPPLDLHHPVVVGVMIEGLKHDRIRDNHRVFQEVLASDAGFLPVVLDAFKNSDDPQQKALLAEILIGSGAPTYYEPTLPYLHEMMRHDTKAFDYHRGHSMIRWELRWGRNR
jgi:hypothetical protein